MNEVIRRKEPMNTAIMQADPSLFCASLMGWLEITSFVMAQRAGTAKPSPDGSIPALKPEDYKSQGVQTIANDSVFAFCIAAALKGDADTVAKMEAGLTEQFGKDFPGSFALWHFRTDMETPETLDDHAGQAGKKLLEKVDLEAKDTWNAGLRLFEKAGKTNFARELDPVLAVWHRERWTWIIENQRFYILQPDINLPVVKEALSDERNDRSFTAALLMAATEAVGMELSEEYVGHLKSIARRV